MMENNIRDIRIDDFKYDLVEEKIAKYPLSERDKCKLLVFDGYNITDRYFYELPEILPRNTLLVYNNSRVINARILFRKGDNGKGAKIEIFCLEPYLPEDYAMNFASKGECEWKCMIGNSKRWKGETILKRETIIKGETVKIFAERLKHEENFSVVRFSWNNADISFSEIIEAVGVIPIPPYLNRDTENTDKEDYQTVYSRPEGSVAAPTAGLHFTEKTLKDLEDKGVIRGEVTLHVGAGTFQPVNSEKIGEHEMHREFFTVSKKLIEDLIEICSNRCEKKIIAVGTTTVRVLESLYFIGCLIEQGKWTGVLPQWYAYSDNIPRLSIIESLNNVLEKCSSGFFMGETQLLIAPGFSFRIIDGMVTNFHQPGSTLLLLVSAFLNRRNDSHDSWRRIYDYALENGYRFLSYGDACLFL